MTIKQDVVTLWDDGIVKFGLFSLPEAAQYIYTDGLPCISIGVFYENMKFKGQDTFTFFDHLYIELLDLIKETYRSMNGSFQIYDMGAETDGYIDFKMGKENYISKVS